MRSVISLLAVSVVLAACPAAFAADPAPTGQAGNDVNQKIEEVRAMVKDVIPGSTRMLLAGYGSAGFSHQNHNGDTAFSAQFNPMLLWKLSDQLLFEGELEAELEDTDTSIALETAQIGYFVNDYLTFGAGKFLNPMNYFVERQHPDWINKLPDKPLAVYDGLLPEAYVGAELRGGIPVGPTKMGYAFFVTNAPELNADPNSVDPTDLGTLEFNNFSNVGNNVALGGRVGFYVVPELELGYGFQWSKVSPSGGGSSVDAWMHSVDLSYVSESDMWKGILNVHAQWVWSKVDHFTYDPGDVVGGPFDFNNKRNGGYAQVAYRPTRLGNKFLGRFEPVFRFDMLKQKKTLTGVNEDRETVGLNYWLNQSTAFKVAYQFDNQSGPEADSHDAVLVQFTAGF